MPPTKKRRGSKFSKPKGKKKRLKKAEPSSEGSQVEGAETPPSEAVTGISSPSSEDAVSRVSLSASGVFVNAASVSVNQSGVSVIG